jgi:hypothetical protein
MNLNNAITKWRTIVESLWIKNKKLNELIGIYAEWIMIKDQSTQQIFEELPKLFKEIKEKITLNSEYKEVKMFLNETTGNIEYYIDGHIYSETNYQVSVETILNVFGEEFINFLIEEKYDLIKDIRQYKLNKLSCQ